MLSYAAVSRNKDAILKTLTPYLVSKSPLRILEISSGSGEHITQFASTFPQHFFQPSEVNDRCLQSIDAYRLHHRLTNMAAPALIDITTLASSWIIPSSNQQADPHATAPLPPGSPGSWDLIFNANMIHISSSTSVDGLFRNAGTLLKPGTGVLFLYGPFSIDGEIYPESNINFDAGLRSQNPDWGLRDTSFLAELGRNNLLNFIKVHDMPANNKVLVFQRAP